MHRGLPGRDEGAARPVVRIEPVEDEPGWVLITQVSTRFPGSETRERARADQGRDLRGRPPDQARRDRVGGGGDGARRR
ncbi:hypothetical protein, partial [Streptomyces anulatus]|uniref:hypothetical protein n=1 Tax=Streptomyces anulatus TaxID=1892 RepID=UPI0034116EC0